MKLFKKWEVNNENFKTFRDDIQIIETIKI